MKLRSEIRKEQAKRRIQMRSNIMNARTGDTKLFYQLIKKQCKAGNTFITDLHVKDSIFCGEDIVQGWK